MWVVLCHYMGSKLEVYWQICCGCYVVAVSPVLIFSKMQLRFDL